MIAKTGPTGAGGQPDDTVSVGVSSPGRHSGTLTGCTGLRSRRRTVRVVLVFLAASVALVAIPGPNVLFVLARGLAGGRRPRSSVLGVETATACFVAAAAFGLTALLVSSAIAFAVVRYAGAVYLLVLAVRALRSGVDVVAGGGAGRAHVPAGVPGRHLQPEGRGVLPRLPAAVRHASRQFLLLGLVFLAVAVTVDLGWALLSGQLGRWLRRHPACCAGSGSSPRRSTSRSPGTRRRRSGPRQPHQRGPGRVRTTTDLPGPAGGRRAPARGSQVHGRSPGPEQQQQLLALVHRPGPQHHRDPAGTRSTPRPGCTPVRTPVLA